jgi:hypothetical protein
MRTRASRATNLEHQLSATNLEHQLSATSLEHRERERLVLPNSPASNYPKNARTRSH